MAAACPPAEPAGPHADYVTGPARAFARKPSRVDHVQAGAVPLAALTAWQALVDTADVRAGQRVLIHAAAGGVGHLAVQIAKARGAYVIRTASAGKHEFLRGLGADELIDYREVDFGAAVGDVDVVLDTIGSDDYRTRSLGVLRRGGLLVSILPMGRDELSAAAERAGKRAEVLLVEADHAGMSAVADVISGACGFCAKAFETEQHVHDAGVGTTEEYEGHPSFRNLLVEGYSVLTF